MKRPLLTVTAAIEAGTGALLVAVPGWTARALLGSPLDSPTGSVMARAFGLALVSLGLACRLARGNPDGRSTAGLVGCMLLYNFSIPLLLIHARIALGLSGFALVPAVLVHSGLGAWCVACLRVRGRDAG